ncbi:hypothetical protein [Streptomyces sp. NPDC007346]|uniref:hypothetical protein n=1 Tax=Streptomyces sp. NPDC007346 TaxID=3154682 RepID=UPI003451C434
MTSDLTTPHLLQLEQAALDAQAAATSASPPADAWETWRQAAAAVQQAITDHAKEAKANRVHVEMAVKKAVRHPTPPA